MELADCPYGPGAYRYLYEPTIRPASTVRTPAHDDFSYTLVMMRTGRLFTVYGAPVWASDKSRFLTVACSLQPARGSLVIQKPSDEGLATDGEIALPCEAESCSARWDHPSWIAVTSARPVTGGKKGTEFVVIRGNDGTEADLKSARGLARLAPPVPRLRQLLFQKRAGHELRSTSAVPPPMVNMRTSRAMRSSGSSRE